MKKWYSRGGLYDNDDIPDLITDLYNLGIREIKVGKNAASNVVVGCLWLDGEQDLEDVCYDFIMDVSGDFVDWWQSSSIPPAGFENYTCWWEFD